MSRNAESRFAVNPTNVDISRSSFNRSHSVKFSFNVGDLIPFYVDEVLPGDTFKVNTSKVVRLQTLLTPVMDNMYLDTYYFFVPNRLVWEHWKQFNGENTASAWIPSTTYQVPQITSPSTGWNVGTIADYMGIPTGVAGLSVNALPIRAYALICNEWFRDENLCNPLSIPINDSTVAGVNTGTFVSDVAKGGLPYKAAKYHDYFTSCLPDPQKGPDVTIGVTGMAPVVTDKNAIPFATFPKDTSNHAYVMQMRTVDDSNTYNGSVTLRYKGNGSSKIYNADSVGDGVSYNRGTSVVPTNLYADLASLSATTINQLRMAFQLQKLYEKDARGGTRYIELLKSHFGVTSPDYRLQRPEYLGGNRLPIIVNQVVQQSATATGQTAQGNVAGYSLTTDSHRDFTKSFTEHGFIVGICVARYDHTYQQGLERMWSRKDRFDYYWPVLANIGEQAVKNKEIYAQGSSVVNPSTGIAYDEEVFGYQEAWADYRYKPSRVSGEMRSSYTTPLDKWHFADDYSSMPYLSDTWIVEDKSNVDRALAVQSSVSNQLLADFYIQNKTVRPMPLYSIPGLIDHH